MIFATTVLFATATATANKAASPIGYEMFVLNKAKYHMVVGDLNSGLVAASTVHTPRLTSVWTLLGHGHPVAAITGTFFSPAQQKPVADVLIDGNLVSHGSRGSAIGVSYFGEVKIFDRPFLQAVDWGEYRFGLRGTVRVIESGKVMPNPKSQRFQDSRLWGRAARTGIGTTANGKVVLIATKTSVTLSELGRAMRSKGVTDGISLDGGGSTCLYYRGSLIVPPSRKLSNLFVLSQKPAEEVATSATGTP